jgi:hypothetical protein
VFSLRKNNHSGELLHFINLMLRADKRKTRIDCALFVHFPAGKEGYRRGAPSVMTALKAN